MSRRQLSLAWRLTLPVTASCLLFTFTGFWGESGWLMDLTSHFRPQYLAWLASTALVLAFRSNGRCPFTKVVITLSALAASVNLAMLVPYWIHPPVAARVSSTPLKLVACNVNSYFGDPGKVERMVRDENPDVFLLTEVTSQWLVALKNLRRDWPYGCSEDREDSFGIALYSRKPVREAKIEHLGSQGLPCIRAVLEHDSQFLTLLGTHPAPPKSPRYAQWRNEDMAAMPSFLGSKGHRMILGDLNSTIWCAPYRKLVREAGLQDAARGFGWKPTWPTMLPLLGVAIDHALVSPGIIVTEHRLGPGIASDHWPLAVTVTLSAD
ncbi:MAG: endonuclease/exonuclease/phosphatase family protein [Planctomycetota bacterium]